MMHYSCVLCLNCVCVCVCVYVYVCVCVCVCIIYFFDLVRSIDWRVGKGTVGVRMRRDRVRTVPLQYYSIFFKGTHKINKISM